jgi:hypothetical protein
MSFNNIDREQCRMRMRFWDWKHQTQREKIKGHDNEHQPPPIA